MMKKDTVMKCPLCRKETRWMDNPSQPFCSERCKQIDLGNWASGTYAVPVDDIGKSEE